VVHLDLVEADLRALAQQAARTCALAADEATDRLVLDLPEAPVLARVDARRLLPALQNLVGNALKYSPGGEPVTVHVREDGPTALVEVADRGIGIPADEVAHLGERFFRASTAAEHDVDGTGLGLATVLAVASAHEGTLAVDSIPGEGSTFRLRLPRRLS
jgi:signal transduction histidine kinase